MKVNKSFVSQKKKWRFNSVKKNDTLCVIFQFIYLFIYFYSPVSILNLRIKQVLIVF